MNRHPIAWNAAKLEVPLGPDPDRDERYRAMRRRQATQHDETRPPLWRRLIRKAA